MQAPYIYQLPKQITYIAEALQKKDSEAYLVGGILRDSILKLTNPDIDIAVVGSAFDVANTIAKIINGKCFELDSLRSTYRVTASDSEPKTQIDVATVQNDIHNDLSKRDFTVNTLALDLKAVNFAESMPQFSISQIINNHNGIEDLRNSFLRMTNDRVFKKDPIRILRAVRLAAQYNLTIEDKTKTQIKKNNTLISEISGERVREEFLKLLSMENTVTNLRTLDELGILTNIIPELEPCRKTAQNLDHHWKVLDHMLETAGQVENLITGKQFNSGPYPEFISDYIPKNELNINYFSQMYSEGHSRLTLLKLSSILHDIGKPDTKTIESDGKIRFLTHEKLGGEIAYTILKRLKFSNSGVESIRNQIENHLRPSQISNPGEKPSSKAIRKYYKDTKSDSLDILYLNMADYIAAKGPNLTRKEWKDHCRKIEIIQNNESSYKKAINQRKLLSGHDIMFGLCLKPGPLIGILIEEVEEARMEKLISNKEEALELIRRRIGSGEYIA